MATDEAPEVVRDLLRLRRWSVAVLSARSVSEDVSSIPAQTWQKFLFLERCAAFLVDRLEQSGSMSSAGAVAEAVLRSAAAKESQSALGARADGLELAAIAKRFDFPVVVLKGGVRAMSGASPPLPLADIDVLVPQEHVDDVVSALESAGFGKRVRSLDHHLGLSPSSERIAVEVHWTIHYGAAPLDPRIWSRVRPIESVPHLHRLGNPDHVAHMVEHAAVTHSERSVSLRDTLLIGETAARCSAGDLSEIKRAIVHSNAELSLLDFAQSIHAGTTTNDPFVESCATFYSAVVLAGDKSRPLRSRGAFAFITAMEIGKVPRLRTLREVIKWRGTGAASLSRAADFVPGLGPLLLGPAHLAYYSIVAALTIPEIRRTKAKALNLLALQSS